MFLFFSKMYHCYPNVPIPVVALEEMEMYMSVLGTPLFQQEASGYLYGVMDNSFVCCSNIVYNVGESFESRFNQIPCYADLDEEHQCLRPPNLRELRYLDILARFCLKASRASDTKILYALFCCSVSDCCLPRLPDEDHQLMFKKMKSSARRAANSGVPFVGDHWHSLGPGEEERQSDLLDSILIGLDQVKNKHDSMKLRDRYRNGKAVTAQLHTYISASSMWPQ